MPIDKNEGWPLKRWMEAAILFVLPILLYTPSLGYGLLQLDDHYYYLLNTSLHDGKPQGLIDLWKAPFFNDYFPVTQVTIWIDLALFGHGQLWGARIHELLWFGLGVWAVRGVMERLTGSRKTAFVAALMYAVHPVCAQSVLWLAERKNVVAFALTYWSFERYMAARQAGTARGAAARFAASYLLAVAALFAKVHAVAIAPAIIIYELFADKTAPESDARAWNWGPAQRILAPLLFFVSCVLFVKFNLPLHSDLSDQMLGGSHLGTLSCDGEILSRYLWQSVFPIKQAMFYDVHVTDVYSLRNALLWGATLMVVALMIFAARRRKLALMAWLIGASLLAPAMNAANQYFTMSDHYYQWALPFPLLILCMTVDDILCRITKAEAIMPRAVFAAAALLFFTLLTVLHTPDFSSGTALYTASFTREPESVLAQAHYATILNTSAKPEEKALAAPLAFRALQHADAQRIVEHDRKALTVIACVGMFRAGQAKEAMQLLDEQCNLFPKNLTQMVRLIKAQVAIMTNRPQTAIEILTPAFEKRHEAAAVALREKCRDGKMLPDALPPQVKINFGAAGIVDSEGQENYRESIYILAASYFNAKNPERAFDVCAVLVNMQPNFKKGRMLLAAIYDEFKLPEAANALRAK